jgi:phosphopentomutase
MSQPRFDSTPMRALLIVLGGAGCGETPDAARFGDAGANTLGYVFEAYPELELPALFSLGLWKSVTGEVFSPRAQGTLARWGRMRPHSPGKEPISAHWEMAGVVLSEPFADAREVPAELVRAIAQDTGKELLAASPGDPAAVIQETSREHLRTGHPIIFTSANSGLEIAAHEQVLPPARLYELCRRARRRADAWRYARVTARPFTGEPGKFQLLESYGCPMVPPRSVLNAIAEKGLPVHGIGEVSRFFAGSGVTRSFPVASTGAGLEVIRQSWKTGDDGFTFASLPLGSPAGDPPDLATTARGLAQFDEWLGALLPIVEEDDLVIVTGDYGSDPRFSGKASTREEVPLLVMYDRKHAPLGTRKSFVDVAATLARYFEVRGGWGVGKSMI